jgi:hypothetical protein
MKHSLRLDPEWEAVISMKSNNVFRNFQLLSIQWTVKAENDVEKLDVVQISVVIETRLIV